jgi:hypothetical protein
MEPLRQDETIAPETELSPIEQLKQQWSQQPGAIPFLKQKNTIDQNIELLPYAGVAGIKGWIPPQLFALQGLVLVAVVLSFLNWYMTRDAGKLHDEVVAMQATVQAEVKRQEEIIGATQAEIKRISSSPKTTFNLHLSQTPLTREEALQELNSSLEESGKSEQQYKDQMAAREKTLRARQRAQAITDSGAPIVFSLALVLVAYLFGQWAQKSYARSRQVRHAGDYYLYCATTEGLFPNLVLLAFLHVALSGNTYGLGGLFGSVGPLFWVVFWISFYFLLLRYFVMVSRGVYKAMQIRPPGNEWSLENHMLVLIHNSFLVTLIGLEVVFLGLCYVLYLVQRSVS